ncbi:anti-sigma factor [Rhodococcus sp. NPDC056506]|uniref:anti-sigma factor n=1 Tax=Rhodococcus sp. NPDC056506 TaxID=3345844 RepID=UPI0036706E02
MTSFERANKRPAPPSAALTVAATPEHLGVLRALVRTAAAQYPLSMDALTDLVLAADEVANTLVDRAVPTSALSCTFAVNSEQRLLVSVTAGTSHEITCSNTSFGRIVLEVLVDDVKLAQIPTVDGNWSVTITLSKALQAGS